MSPEDSATISMQPDTHSDYTFWLAWGPRLSLKQKQFGRGADPGPGFLRERNDAAVTSSGSDDSRFAFPTLSDSQALKDVFICCWAAEGKSLEM